ARSFGGVQALQRALLNALDASGAGAEDLRRALRLMLHGAVHEDQADHVTSAAGREEPRIEPARRVADQDIGSRKAGRLEAQVQVAGDGFAVPRRRSRVAESIAGAVIGAGPGELPQSGLDAGPGPGVGAVARFEDHR